MSRTRRHKHSGDKGLDRDGAIRPEGQIHPHDFAVEVIRRERREREAEADRLAKRRGRSRGLADEASSPATMATLETALNNPPPSNRPPP